jgi:hypothetical protein
LGRGRPRRTRQRTNTPTGTAVQSGGGSALVLTDTEHFVLRSADGLYGKVQVVYHVNVARHEFTFDRGTFESPHG